MPFVQVENIRAYIQCVDQPNASEAEDHFLFQPVLVIASVQLIGDSTVLLTVFGNVGIQKVKRYAAYINFPGFGSYRPAGKGNFYFYPFALLIPDRNKRQLGEFLRFVLGDLLPLVIDKLFKVPLPVQQTDTN